MDSAILTLEAEIETLKYALKTNRDSFFKIGVLVSIDEHQRAIEILQSANLNTK